MDEVGQPGFEPLVYRRTDRLSRLWIVLLALAGLGVSGLLVVGGLLMVGLLLGLVVMAAGGVLLAVHRSGTVWVDRHGVTLPRPKSQRHLPPLVFPWRDVVALQVQSGPAGCSLSLLRRPAAMYQPMPTLTLPAPWALRGRTKKLEDQFGQIADVWRRAGGSGTLTVLPGRRRRELLGFVVMMLTPLLLPILVTDHGLVQEPPWEHQWWPGAEVASAPDPCTVADSAAVGALVPGTTGVRSSPPPEGTECTWSQDGDHPTLSVTVTRFGDRLVDTGTSRARSTFQDDRERARYRDTPRRIGDVAFESTLDSEDSDVYVRRANVIVEVAYTSPPLGSGLSSERPDPQQVHKETEAIARSAVAALRF